VGEGFVLWSLVDFNENPPGRKSDFAASIDICELLVIDEKVAAHIEVELEIQFLQSAEWRVIVSIFVGELDAHRCRLAGGGGVDANVNGVKRPRHAVILISPTLRQNGVFSTKEE
jgi:hypothetical protein